MTSVAPAPPYTLLADLRRQLATHGTPVTCLETHISWVLLAGTDAYKLKKPLRLDVLDFSTTEARHAACLEELRINRRTAPELYLQVLPVTQDGHAARIGGHGPVLDWLVHMRRFPAEALLAERARAGLLTPTDIDALAREIAAFQQRAAVAAPDTPHGAAAALAQLVADCLAALDAAPPALGLAPQLAELRAWTAAEAARLEPLIAQRRTEGFVREGHGDLHLANLLWLDGRPRLFDAIEFNPALRWIDTVTDLAFLFMDLHAHGQPELAWRLVNTWLERSGDYAGLRRLAYDAVYRALVRAKVAALRLSHAADDAATHSATQAEVRRYVALAMRLAAPRQPWLALTMGVSGSGKSRGSQPLVETRGLIRLRADVERKRLFGLAPEASSRAVPGGIYSDAASDRTLTRLAELARLLLQAGLPVLVDATFIRRQRRADFIALAQTLGVPWRILAFQAPRPVLRQRIAARLARGDDASEADLAVLDSQLADVQPLEFDEAQHAIPIDGTQALDPGYWHSVTGLPG